MQSVDPRVEKIPLPHFCQKPQQQQQHKQQAEAATTQQQLTKQSNKNHDINAIFEKKFHYQAEKELQHLELPTASQLYQEFYQLQSLQLLKKRLNAIKSKLNDFVIEEWSSHTRKTNPAVQIPWQLKNITQAEFVTVAWCKMYECLQSYQLVKLPRLNSLHLCEAPGAFITALNHYLHSNFGSEQVQWNWLATTLNVYYEGNPFGNMIVDDYFMQHTLQHWLFHKDFTGNIMKRANIEHMIEQCAQRLGEVHLITADGSVDCMESPDKQEEAVAQLHFAELTAALSILAAGGSLVLKMFTLFEACSISNMFLLNCVFRDVHVFKPATSKRGNSEVYVVCLDYQKHLKQLPDILELMLCRLEQQQLPMFAKSQLPLYFLQQHERCARYFMNLQIDVIESNLQHFQKRLPHEAIYLKQLRKRVCDEFYKRYKIRPIAEHLKIVQQYKERKIQGYFYKGSYSERQLLQAESYEQQVFQLQRILNQLENSLNLQKGLLYEEQQQQEQQELPMQIYKAAPFNTLNISVFATLHVLLFRKKLQNYFQVDALWSVRTPKCVLEAPEQTSEAEQHISLDASLCTTQYCSMQQQFFVCILDGILTQKPNRIIFQHFPFLSHYSVSVLRYLCSHFYRRLSISNDIDMPQIILHGLREDATKLQELQQLKELLSGDLSIFCILNINHLHYNDFSQAIIEYNNYLLLQNFKQLLSI